MATSDTPTLSSSYCTQPHTTLKRQEEQHTTAKNASVVVDVCTREYTVEGQSMDELFANIMLYPTNSDLMSSEGKG